MGSYVFKWTKPASEVYVTGEFDNWSKSEKLERVGDIWEKKLHLPDADDKKKIYYKFVVDGSWTTDHEQPQEHDSSGIVNNFLIPDHITKQSIPAPAAIMSGVTPESTTAELAKSAPLENSASADLPGSFPETPALDSPNKNFSVNPLPATEGAGNPIKLAAGEKVPEPSTITANTVDSTVKLDKESYEKGESEPPMLPNVVTPQNERDLNGTGVLDLPPITSTLIPESSLPMFSDGLGSFDPAFSDGLGKFDLAPTIQSASPTSTTAQLAAAVPLESAKVPETVVQSQKEAGVEPEASDVAAEVQDKSDLEKELLEEVPEAPVTSEGAAQQDADKPEAGINASETVAAVGGATVAAGGAAAAAAHAAKDKVVEAATAAESVPEVVKESIAEAGQSPEAAAHTGPIAEKSAVEQELLSEVKPEESTGEPAPKIVATPAAETPTAAPPNRETISPSGLNADASTDVTGKTSPSVSRDISPSTVPGTHTQTEPEVTTGVNSSTTAPATPAKDIGTQAVPTKSNGSKDASSTDKKKKKRRSFFGRLKDKFSSDKEKATSAN